MPPETVPIIEVAGVITAWVALWSASWAWWTYRGSIRERNNSEYAAKLNLIRALKSELEIIYEWACGDGYKSASLEEYEKWAEKESTGEVSGLGLRSWYRPSRIIFSFSYASIKNVIAHPHLHELPNNIVHGLALLDHSITAFFDSYNALRDLVGRHPDIAFRVDWKLGNNNNDFSKEEHMFKEEVFRRNYGLHVQRIGSADSPECDHCLYRTYRSARQAVEEFEDQLKPKDGPPLFALGDVLAGVLFGLGGYTAWFVTQRVFLEGVPLMLIRFLDVWIVFVILALWSLAWWKAKNPNSIHLESARSTIEAGLSFVSIVLPIVVGALLLAYQSETRSLPERTIGNMLMATYWLVLSAAIAVWNLSRLPSMPVKDERIADRLTPVLGAAQLVCLLVGAIRMVFGIRVLWTNN